MEKKVEEQHESRQYGRGRREDRGRGGIGKDDEERKDSKGGKKKGRR